MLKGLVSGECEFGNLGTTARREFTSRVNVLGNWGLSYNEKTYPNIGALRQNMTLQITVIVRLHLQC